MRARNIELSQAKELLCGGKIDDNGNAGINWKALQDEFINLERGDRRKKTLNGLKLRMERILEYFETKPKPRNSEQLFRKSYLIPFFLVISGSIYASLIHGFNLPQINKAIILLVILTLSNSFIAIFGSRLIKGQDDI